MYITNLNKIASIVNKNEEKTSMCLRYPGLLLFSSTTKKHIWSTEPRAWMERTPVGIQKYAAKKSYI